MVLIVDVPTLNPRRASVQCFWALRRGCLVTQKYLNASCVPQENERTKDMIIEQRFHRAIIGQKGEKIKEIRDKFPEASLSLKFYLVTCILKPLCMCEMLIQNLATLSAGHH